jgi:hypothetical protein
MGQNYNIKIGNKSIERMEHFKYSAAVITNQNCIHYWIKEQTELRESLLSFIPESCVCQLAIQKFNH